jgi:hypothetical protein
MSEKQTVVGIDVSNGVETHVEGHWKDGHLYITDSYEVSHMSQLKALEAILSDFKVLKKELQYDGASGYVDEMLADFERKLESVVDTERTSDTTLDTTPASSQPE